MLAALNSAGPPGPGLPLSLPAVVAEDRYDFLIHLFGQFIIARPAGGALYPPFCRRGDRYPSHMCLFACLLLFYVSSKAEIVG